MRVLLLLGLWFPLLAVADYSTALQARLASIGATAERILYYQEERSSKLLNRPVVYNGRLQYEPSTGRLTKWVDAPQQARLTVTDTHLEATTGSGRERRLALDARPDMAALLLGLRALLSGNPEMLKVQFSARYLEAEDNSWVLQLTPHSPDVSAYLMALEVRGQGDHLLRIDTVDAQGQRQQMRIVPAPSVTSPDDR